MSNLKTILEEAEGKEVWLSLDSSDSPKLLHQFLSFASRYGLQYGLQVQGVLSDGPLQGDVPAPVKLYSEVDFSDVETVFLLSVNSLNKCYRALDEIRTKNNYDFEIVDSIFDDLIFKPNVPQEVRYDSTNDCNLTCGYCHLQSPVAKKNPWMTLESYCSVNDEKREDVDVIQPEDRKGRQSKIDDFHNLISNIGEVRELALSCATEPLLNKDFDKIVRASTDYPTSVVTNAVLLTPKIVDEFIESKLNLLSISIDSAEDGLMKKYRGINASFIFKKLKMIQERKLHYNVRHPAVFLSYVMTSENTSHLEDLIETAAKYGIDGINVSRVMPRNDHFRDRSPTDEEVMEVVRGALPLAEKCNIKLTFNYSDKLRPERINGFCERPLSYRYVDYAGNVIPCFKKRLGNIFEEKLDTMLERNKEDLIEAMHMRSPYCQHCHI